VVVRDSLISGKTLTPELLRLKMRRRGWLGWGKNSEGLDISSNRSYIL